MYFGRDSPDGGTDIATLVRRSLTEVCTVPVLLVVKYNSGFSEVWVNLDKYIASADIS